MKLAATINAWGDTVELLPSCLDHILPLVDHVFVIWSEKSNYGESDRIMVVFAEYCKHERVTFIRCEPDSNKRPYENECFKRNAGLNAARDAGFTHFLSMDSDEFYEAEPFLKDKERFLNENLIGLVCQSQVYFKHPWLTIGLDTTLVTFIHKITPTLKFGMNRLYPFAFDKTIRIDPTRQLNIKSGVQMSDIVMHHMSWVRSDFEKKIRNSTAKGNIEQSTIRQDLMFAKEGHYCNFYGKTLFRATVNFNIPDVQSYQKSLEASDTRQS
jgi:hypothetical protein